MPGNSTKMNLSNVRLVVTDMDGTLLNSAHEVSDRFFELYQALKAKGVVFAAASGRQYNSIAQKLDPIRDEIVIIAENGGLAINRGTEVLSTPLDPRLKNEILSALEGILGSHPVLCARDNAYLLDSEPAFLEKLKEYYTRFELLSDLKAYRGEIMKIAVFHFEGSEKHIYPAVKRFEGDLKVKVSGENWVDLSHPDAHKGFALSKIQEHYGISSSETMVFGDYNNDLEMLEQAQFSFAMANAHPNVLQAAKYTTKSNDEFGVEIVLEKLLASL